MQSKPCGHQRWTAGENGLCLGDRGRADERFLTSSPERMSQATTSYFRPQAGLAASPRRTRHKSWWAPPAPPPRLPHVCATTQIPRTRCCPLPARCEDCGQRRTHTPIGWRQAERLDWRARPRPPGLPPETRSLCTDPVATHAEGGFAPAVSKGAEDPEHPVSAARATSWSVSAPGAEGPGGPSSQARRGPVGPCCLST